MRQSFIVTTNEEYVIQALFNSRTTPNRLYNLLAKYVNESFQSLESVYGYLRRLQEKGLVEMDSAARYQLTEKGVQYANAAMAYWNLLTRQRSSEILCTAKVNGLSIAYTTTLEAHKANPFE